MISKYKNFLNLFFSDFGFISMDIKGVIPEDSGIYSVVAKNALGEDVRQCQVIITGKDSILSTTQHEDSIAKIQYLESLNKYGRIEVEEHGPDVSAEKRGNKL